MNQNCQYRRQRKRRVNHKRLPKGCRYIKLTKSVYRLRNRTKNQPTSQTANTFRSQMTQNRQYRRQRKRPACRRKQPKGCRPVKLTKKLRRRNRSQNREQFKYQPTRESSEDRKRRRPCPKGCNPS